MGWLSPHRLQMVCAEMALCQHCHFRPSIDSSFLFHPIRVLGAGGPGGR